MRNPLNSIINLSQEFERKVDKLQFILQGANNTIDPVLNCKLSDFLEESKLNSQKQNTSSKLLSFFVNDVLDFTQIRLGKLKKNINGFNLK